MSRQANGYNQRELYIQSQLKTELPSFASSVMILSLLGLDKRTTLVLSNTRELDRVPSTK